MFKDSFKYYKSKKPPPDFSKIIDTSTNSKDLELLLPHSASSHPPGLNSLSTWQVYKIKSKEGLIFIKNPFTPAGQRYWISRCLRDYTKKPQKLNIDAHNYLKENEDWWTICKNDSGLIKDSLVRKLRWATLGYHHNWDTKIYSESSKDEFPSDLAELSRYVAEVVGFKDFNAEAAIVNFYHMDSTLSGHTDYSEENLEAPLLSFSFGQSAIFLIGGLTEDCPAVPIFLHSGDIVIMSKESRLCYHAVPRITPSPNQPWNEEHKETFNSEIKSELCWKPFDNYIQKSRININVRQVLKKRQNKLDR